MIYKLLYCATFFLVLSTEMDAQGKSHGQGPPPWAPAHGYRAKTRHLYFPEYNFYYDLEKRMYIYLQAGRWTIGVELPARLGNVNLRIASKIELDINTDAPQLFNGEHQMKYRPKYAVATASPPPGKSTEWKEHPGKGKGNAKHGKK